MNRISWKDVYRQWRYCCTELRVPTDEMAVFRTIWVEHLPRHLDETGVDWWPRQEIETRSASLAEGNAYPRPRTKRGTLHTARALYESRGDPERQAAVWMMASLWDKRCHLSEAWIGETYSLLEELFCQIGSAFPGLPPWHHAARDALPVSVGCYYPADDFIRPTTYSHVVYLSALEAGIALGTWQLVRLVPKPR